MSANAATMLPPLDQTQKYVAIQLDDENEFDPQGSGGSDGSKQRSTFGRISAPSDVASPPGIPDLEAGNIPLYQRVPGGPNGSDTPFADYNGRVALTHPGAEYNPSNTDFYVMDGETAIDCAGSSCKASVSNSALLYPDQGANFVQRPGTTTYGVLGPASGTMGDVQGDIGSGGGSGLGVEENVDFTELLDDLLQWKDVFTDPTKIAMLDANSYDLNLGDGQVNNYNSGDKGDFILSENIVNQGAGAGVPDPFGLLNIINVNTDGNDFLINNSNFLVDGQKEGEKFIFLVDENDNENMTISNGRVLPSQAMASQNILFLIVNGDNGNNFNLSNAEFYGVSFWDLSMGSGGDYIGNVSWNNVRGCGQVVSGNLSDLNDFNVNNCALVPVPAALPLGATGIGILTVLGWIRRRRGNAAA